MSHRSDSHQPIQVRLAVPHSLSPVVTTAHARPVTCASPTSSTLSRTLEPEQDIAAMIDASDNPLEFFLTSEPNRAKTSKTESAAPIFPSTVFSEEAFPTPEALDASDDGDYFLDSGIEDLRESTPPTRTVSPSQISDMLKLPSPIGGSSASQHSFSHFFLSPSVSTAARGQREVISRPRSPHPAATDILSSFLAPPAPSASAANTLIPPGHGRLGRATPPPPHRMTSSPTSSWTDDASFSGSDSDSDTGSVHSVPASIDGDDGEDYIHFLSGGVGMAGTSYRRAISKGNGAPSIVVGAYPHSYPPYPEYTPARKATDSHLGTRVGSSPPSTPPRAMSPTAHRRGRSLKARNRRGVVAHGGRWRWAAREPSPDVWIIEEEQEEDHEQQQHQRLLSTSVGSLVSNTSSNLSLTSGRLGSPSVSFLGRPASPISRRGVSPAGSVRSDSSRGDDMGLKKLRLVEPDEEGEVLFHTGREVFPGEEDEESHSRNHDGGEGVCYGKTVRRVRFVLPL